MLCLLTGLAVILVAVAPQAATAYAGMAVAGFTSIWFIAAANTLVQLSSVNALRGRVLSVWNMALPGTLPLTGLITAWIDEAIGPRSGFAASGVALLLTAAVGWLALGRHRPGEITEVHSIEAHITQVRSTEITEAR
jgi:sugar phosphate permease